MRVMTKYTHVINLGIQSTLVYRVNFVVRAVFGLVPLLALILLWRAIYEGRADDDVGGYRLAEVITYYLIVNVVVALTSSRRTTGRSPGYPRRANQPVSPQTDRLPPLPVVSLRRGPSGLHRGRPPSHGGLSLGAREHLLSQPRGCTRRVRRLHLSYAPAVFISFTMALLAF
jgi:hypothetical protein